MLSKQSLLKRRLEMCNVRTRPVIGHLWCLSKSIWRFGIWQSDLMLKPKFVTCHYQRCKRADRQDCRAGAQKMMNWQGHILASSYLELAFSEWIPNLFIFFINHVPFILEMFFYDYDPSKLDLYSQKKMQFSEEKKWLSSCTRCMWWYVLNISQLVISPKRK